MVFLFLLSVMVFWFLGVQDGALFVSAFLQEKITWEHIWWSPLFTLLINADSYKQMKCMLNQRITWQIRRVKRVPLLEPTILNSTSSSNITCSSLVVRAISRMTLRWLRAHPITDAVELWLHKNVMKDGRNDRIGAWNLITSRQRWCFELLVWDQCDVLRTYRT